MLNIRPFRQDTAFCGPASLKAVLYYFGIRKTEKDLAHRMGATKRTGTNIHKLSETARELGLNASVEENATLRDIRYWVREKEIPVIVDWWNGDDGHYSVVVWVNSENIYLMDPEWGQIRAMRLTTFKRNWFDFRGDYLRKKSDLLLRNMVVIQPRHMHKKKTATKKIK
ncbi:MAG: cysteine peptidase family C39 domain-containing protein [Candidatus Diapherotrites archaeon]